MLFENFEFDQFGVGPVIHSLNSQIVDPRIEYHIWTVDKNFSRNLDLNTD